MKNTIKILFLLSITFFLTPEKKANAQSATFNWNGTSIVIAGYPNHEGGTVQTWTVPACVNVITITATGGAGGACLSGPGGLGAVVTGTVTVASGNVLDIVAGGFGANGDIDGGGGGGGSYVWNSTTSSLLVVAGGGGGEGYVGSDPNGPNGQTTNTTAATLEAPVPDLVNTCGVPGVGGNGGGPGGVTNDGGACGGAGWLSDGGLVAVGTFYYVGYGYYPNSVLTPAYGGVADPYFTNPYEGAGGFGGGAGGGYNGGGGGGGYNGGGGGLGIGGANGDAGGGGGSYCNASTALSTGLGNSGADGSVVIQWTGSAVTATISGTIDITCNGEDNGSAMVTGGGGASPYTYLWNPSAQTNQTATGLSAGTYTVTVKDANGCSNTATVTITQPTILAATAVPTNILCFGGTGTITGNATGGTVPYNYIWTPGGNTNAIASNLSAGSYTLSVTDANGCTTSVSTIITQPAAALAVTVTGPSMICIGSSGTLTATATGGTIPYAYAWSSGITSITSTASVTPAISQNYTVTITDANGCTASGQVAVTLGPTLGASISGTTSMCSGMSTTLCATPIGGTGGNTYLWQPGNQTTPCITVSPASTSTFTVSIVDNCGTTATTTATIRINPSPATDFKANLYQGCAPLCVQFYNTTTISQGGLAQYRWTFGNGDTADIKSPTYCYPANGAYDVSLTVTSDSGCSATLNKAKLIKAFAPPVAAFSFSPQAASILAPTIQFTDNSKDTYNIMYWSWNFGDGTDSNSNIQNPAHTYKDTGTYCTNLAIMDIHGCTDTATNCLVINPVFNLYIPSAFSPNGDGKNEVFQPKGQFIKSFEMYIFDRWGMQLFHTGDITKGWNGTVNGGSTVAQEDTYEYKILVTDSQNKQHTYVGNVSLIK